MTYEMFSRPILLATSNATSSPASAVGHSRPDRQDGRMGDRFGQAPVLASLFPLRDGDAERPIIGTFGPTFIASSAPEGPLLSWENRLRARLARIGSPECALIWRETRLRSGQSMSRLSPSERLTSDSASIGSRNRWSTPRASDGEKGGPNSRDGSGSLHLPAQMYRAAWATPTVKGNFNRKGMSPNAGDGLATQMRAAFGMALQTSGATGTKNGGVPNPEFPCWLMGFPKEFRHSQPLATRSLSRSRRKLSPPTSTVDLE